MAICSSVPADIWLVVVTVAPEILLVALTLPPDNVPVADIEVTVIVRAAKSPLVSRNTTVFPVFAVASPVVVYDPALAPLVTRPADGVVIPASIALANVT